MTAKNSKELGAAKLESSGLTLEDAELLKMSILSPTQTAKLHTSFKQLSSIRIEYRGPDGKPLVDWPGGGPFYRLRYLGKGSGFGEMSGAKKEIRYVQEPCTAPVAYYPQNFDNWEELCADTAKPLIITEGELKAAKACKEGFPAIGIGGVYNWRAKKLGVEWLESLDYVNWVRRNVYLCFDSDYKTNPMVCTALCEFAEELHRRGGFVHLVSLPELPDVDKVGLDDYLVHAGPTANDMFSELLRYAEPLGLSRPLWEMNRSYVYVRNPGLIIDKKDLGNKISPAAFRDHLASAVQYQERAVKKDGSLSFKSVAASAAWLRWPMRQEVKSMTYRPGDESFIDGKFNVWPGWGVKPQDGDVKPFMDLVNHLFSGSSNDSREWFLSWCAAPLQNPGLKMFSSVVIHGVRHGTGKSMIGYTLGKIYGENFTEINQVDLHNSFNDWAESKQFVMGDDVTGSNKRADADFLKKMITQNELRINAKYVPSYTVPDCINYLFTSQHPDSFFLEDDDRRFFIHEVVVGPKDQKFYTDYMKWLNEGGAAHLFHYLLNYNMRDFNPAAPAYRTQAKERMINNGRSDLASWVRQLIYDPDFALTLGGGATATKDLFTSRQLLEFYDSDGRTGTTANGLGRELARAGLRQVCEGKPVRTGDGPQGRFYAVRNSGKWLKASMEDVTAHLGGKKLTRRKKY